MGIVQHLAKGIRDVHFGGNWTSSCFKEQLKGVSWEVAIQSPMGMNSIAALVYHTHYYISVVIPVFQGGQLNASDKFSFDCPSIENSEDWDELLNRVWSDAEMLASLIELLPENRLWEPFTDEKYGNYYRNIQGIIEHCHYHLGQIVLIKKMG